MSNKKLLSRCLKEDTKNVFSLIKEEVKEEGEEGKHFLFFNRESPILLQCHIDVVNKRDFVNLTSQRGIIYNETGVLGADDRAGVFSAIMANNMYTKRPPSLLFTDLEESGGGGMLEFLNTNPNLSAVNLCVALDREGCGQYVYYNELNKQVRNYIESFGFSEKDGVFSDCLYLTNETLIPSVNLSVGFHHQHTAYEELHVDEMYLTIKRLLAVLANPIKTRYNSVKEKFSRLWYGHDFYLDNNIKYLEEEEPFYLSCEGCTTLIEITRMNRVYDPTERKDISVCDKCYTDYGDSFGWIKVNKNNNCKALTMSTTGSEERITVFAP